MDKVMVALSGGLDSVVCLLGLIDNYAKENVMAVHVRHKGRSSARELITCQVLCTKLGIHLDVLDGRGKLGKGGVAQQRALFEYVLPPHTVFSGCTILAGGTDASTSRRTAKEAEAAEFEHDAFWDDINDKVERYWNIAMCTPNEGIRKMELLLPEGKGGCLWLFKKYNISPIWDTYSCFSIAKPGLECGRCIKCLRKYMACRMGYSRAEILPRFACDPLTPRNIRDVRKLLAYYTVHKDVDELSRLSYLDFTDMCKVIEEEMPRLDKHVQDVLF